MAKKKNVAVADGQSKERLRKEFDTLRREMEIAEYATKGHGQYVRKVPRNESLLRTRKRKLLERDDAVELAIHADTDVEKRLRGSKLAFQSEVIEGSKIFGDNKQILEENEDSDDESLIRGNTKSLEGSDNDELEGDEPTENFIEAENEKDQENDSEGEDNESAADDVEEGSNDNNDGDDEVSESERIEAVNAETSRPKKTRTSNTGGSRNRRKLFKIRNFKSFRLAQRHGDALGAHARGLPKVAVEKLKQVARDAPAAPQVYSALGMVYEDMLQTSLKKSRSSVGNEAQQEKTAVECVGELIVDPALAEQIGLAKMAYGSYHVAAILCKKDFTLWVRAADCASEIANLHVRAMMQQHISDGAIKHHRAEKKRWLSEARHDFIVADNLKPPGIDVPAKLAEIEMELGNLSEALTILTDLKNRKGGQNSTRTDFEKSFKAWLLYSDLMLRIGHECTQWNRGVQANQNFMFRRWLRRFALVFDWQERRLQGLIMALEAAAGSKCCEKLLTWAKGRAKKVSEPAIPEIDDKRWHVSSSDATNNKTDSTNESDMRAGDSSKPNLVGELASIDGTEIKQLKPTVGENLVPTNENADERERDKALLLTKNLSELNDFDKTTDDMDLQQGSQASIQRREARLSLVKQHNEALACLESEFKEPNELESRAEADKYQPISYNNSQLPVSGSIATVCSTASELIKHCLGMQLYEGGRLVAEVVTSYFKERASLVDSRMRSRDAFSLKQSSIDESVLLNLEPYDEIDEQAAMSDDENSELVYFSDDEDLEGKESSGLLDTLRRGLLPTEIRVLYALCLVGEGGRDYVAARCIESTRDLEMESENWIFEEPVEVGLNPDPLWNSFCRAMTEPLSRTTAFSFVNDVIRKTGNEKKWSGRLTPLFRGHLEDLKLVGLIDKLLTLPVGLSSYAMMRKNQLLKVVFGAARFEIANVELTIQKVEEIQDCIPLILSTTKLLARLLEALWKVESNGSVSKNIVELLELLARAFSIVLQNKHDDLDVLKDEAGLCNRVVSLFCDCLLPVPSNEVVTQENTSSMHEWKELPIPSNWQSGAHKALSLRVYNLCVSCNVSIFSGWEREEFSLRLLRPGRGVTNFFGVNVDNGSVSGYLSPSQETEICKQLDFISGVLPWASLINFEAHLAEVKESSWYKTLTDEVKSLNPGSVIACHGEEAALNILLCFSKSCLMLASTSEGAVKEQYIQNALSILLPMCEFCLDQKLLESNIGKISTAVSTFEDWKRLAEQAAAKGPLEKSKQSFPRRARVERRVDEWLTGKKDRSTLTNIIKIPAVEMQKEWSKDQNENKAPEGLAASKKVMDQVHLAVAQLRNCYTNSATEKASSQVAVALLDLVGTDHCQNPILCIQHAAMFASQGCKAGNNDERFRKALPISENECTPLEALLILGRADCLQATYFPNEAAFLCCYVARVCRQHRDRLRPELEWTPQWKVIGVLAYNLSVVIRFMMRSFVESDVQKATSFNLWEREVVEELERCRADAISWKKQIEGSDERISDIVRSQTDAFSDEEMVGDDDEEDEIHDGENVSVGVKDGDDDDDDDHESLEDDQNDLIGEDATSDASSAIADDEEEVSPIVKARSSAALDTSNYDDDESEVEEREVIAV